MFDEEMVDVTQAEIEQWGVTEVQPLEIPCWLGRVLWGGIVFGGVVARAGVGWVITRVYEAIDRRGRAQ